MASPTPSSLGSTPQIVAQPVGAQVHVGGQVTFTVSATGSGTLSYQWLHEGKPIQDALYQYYPFSYTGFEGAKTPTLVLRNVQMVDATSYSVAVSDGKQTTVTSVSVQLEVAPAAVAVAAGGRHTCSVDKAGTVSCWGNNQVGQLGTGEVIFTSHFTPTNPVDLSKVTGLAASRSQMFGHTCALVSAGVTVPISLLQTNDGAVACWGDNSAGQTGGASLGPSLHYPLTGGAKALTSGGTHSCAVTTDGMVQCWGDTYPGVNANTVITVAGLSEVVAIAAGETHTCAAKSNGTVWCWGLNASGQLGDGTTTNRLSATQVPGLSGVVTLAAGDFHTCAIQAQGTMYCWGANNAGQLGDGSKVDRPSPVQVMSNVMRVAAGASHTCALAANDLTHYPTASGPIYCWGRNQEGQLGDGTTVDRLSPGQAALTDAMSLSAGRSHNCAIRSNGELLCWGDNSAGQLGTGFTATQPQTTPGLVFF